MTLLNVLRSAADLTGRVVKQLLLLLRIHLPEQVARLLPVIVIHPVIPVRGCARKLERRLVKLTGVPDAWVNGGRSELLLMSSLLGSTLFATVTGVASIRARLLAHGGCT